MSQVSRYHPVLVALHWLLALLVPVALILGGWVMAKIPNDSPAKIDALRGHMAGGLLILTLMLLRFLVRSRTRLPPPANSGSSFFDGLARVSHYALYVGVIGMAVAGLVLAIQSGMIAILFGELAPIPSDFWVYTARFRALSDLPLPSAVDRVTRRGRTLSHLASQRRIASSDVVRSACFQKQEVEPSRAVSGSF